MRSKDWQVGLALLLACLPVSSLAAEQPGMKPGIEQREVDPRQRPFILKGVISPEKPAVGETLEIAAEIRSRVHPHIRVVVRFFVDDQKREETAYVIAPQAESIATHEWQAVKGKHTIKIEVVSPAGILYESWEGQITIK